MSRAAGRNPYLQSADAEAEVKGLVQREINTAVPVHCGVHLQSAAPTQWHGGVNRIINRVNIYWAIATCLLGPVVIHHHVLIASHKSAMKWRPERLRILPEVTQMLTVCGQARARLFHVLFLQHESSNEVNTDSFLTTTFRPQRDGMTLSWASLGLGSFCNAARVSVLTASASTERFPMSPHRIPARTLSGTWILILRMTTPVAQKAVARGEKKAEESFFVLK